MLKHFCGFKEPPAKVLEYELMRTGLRQLGESDKEMFIEGLIDLI